MSKQSDQQTSRKLGFSMRRNKSPQNPPEEKPAHEVNPNGPGVFFGGGYPKEYEKYETDFPYGFPYTRDEDPDRPRFILYEDGWWRNPDAVDRGKAILCCTGDILGEGRFLRAYRFGDKYFFRPVFKYVKPVLECSDFNIGNLESTVTDSTPYSSEWPVIEGLYHCNSPESLLDGLRYAGFDALVNANNHNCDSAVMGLVDTLDAFDKYQFMHTGTFRPDDPSRFIKVEINGIKVAVLSYATYFNHMDENFTKLGVDTLLNKYSARKAREDIAAARQAGAEFVLVYMHWGKVYTHEISKYQWKWAQELADAGADYIVGSHAQALQPRRTVTSAEGKVVPVVFSLGDFVTNKVREISKQTGILQLTLRREGGEIKVTEVLIPCYIFDEIKGSRFAPVPCDVSLNGYITDAALDSACREIQTVMDELPPPTTSSITFREVGDILGVEIPAELMDQRITCICSKPERVYPGALYLGIIWQAEEYLDAVMQAGAAAVVTEEYYSGGPCIVVDDVGEAYCKIYSYIRKRFDIPAVCITGSTGKTTTKEMMEQVFGDSMILLSSEGNWNTRHTGMIIMQKLRDYHEFYIQEVHEGDPDSAAMMSRAIMPKYAVITNIDKAHRELFDSEEEFIKGFTDITAGLREDGVLLVCADDDKLMQAVAETCGDVNIVTFGINKEDADYSAKDIEYNAETGRLEFAICHGAHSVRAAINSPVRPNVYNALVTYAISMDAGIPEEKIISSLAQYHTDGIRQHIMEYKGLTMMLDCRSAAVSSTISSIHAICDIDPAPGGKRVAVIGDIHLDEDITEEAHRKVGAVIADSNIDMLLCIGEASKYVREEAIRKGFPEDKAFHYTEKRDLELKLSEILRPGDVLLIKGGRRMYLTSTIRKLFQYTMIMD